MSCRTKYKKDHNIGTQSQYDQHVGIKSYPNIQTKYLPVTKLEPTIIILFKLLLSVCSMRLAGIGDFLL